MASRWNPQLLKKEKIAANAWKFIFVRPSEFNFLAGQYVRIFDPIVGRQVFRDFTISSSPHQEGTFELTIEEGISDYKKHLFAIPIGSDVLMDAPLGRFVLQDLKRPYVFLAGGVGIAPFYSMIQYLVEEKIHIPLTIFASFSTVEHVLYFNELKELAEQHLQLQVVYTISQPEKSKLQWNSHTGRISKNVIGQYVGDLNKVDYMIAGSPSFVSSMETLLLEMNVGLGQIKTDIFLGFN